MEFEANKAQAAGEAPEDPEVDKPAAAVPSNNGDKKTARAPACIYTGKNLELLVCDCSTALRKSHI